MAQILFEDIFGVSALNVFGKKFEKVDRLHCKGTTHDVELVLDINSELITVKKSERVVVAFASTLSLDGIPDDGQFNPAPGASLLDSYDYVMHGRVFLIEHLEGTKIKVQASFGGLLMKLQGDQSQLTDFAMDATVFLLMRKGGEDTFMDI